MQQPTLRNVRIRSTRDALAVFYAVARSTLPLITRRLDAEERLAIAAGTVFVWEENANSEATGLGMERWTDGMGWGPSRVRDEFLFYHQKDCDAVDEPINPMTPWAQMMRKRSARGAAACGVSRKLQRLHKQTYSVIVTLPKDRPCGMVRKWHLTAYFNQETLNELDTIDDLRYLDMPVPDGWFRSARATKTRRENRALGGGIDQQQQHNRPSEPGRVSSPTSPLAAGCDMMATFNPVPAAQTRFRGTLRAVFPSSSGSPKLLLPLPPSSPKRAAFMMSSGLVPLEYLQKHSQRNRRNPTDEQLLRRFAAGVY
ncbi:unnamed protein product [Mycena citricolor]|uniref:Gti1/Pac2 family-domain-containing protein n=1 Tax=Mycena citricolor TaxID=2018698 RepID=A0AAD2HDB3_9AGAR|nr:unnamed protein product [Mycena citricolor]CAK5272675.1 unnamed protein product [Mycena citricolor]CAK5272886.1 unnamed protein product [Mycena citricolor]